MRPSEQLRALGVVLPQAPAPKGSYSPAVREGRCLYVSGQIVTDGAAARSPGLVGRDLDAATAKALVREATLQGLAAAAAACGGSLDAVRRAIRVGVYVASAEGFVRQHEVANGATELLNAIFGEELKPARAAMGVARLPLDAPVEVELLLELA